MIAPTSGTAPVTRSSAPRTRRASLIGMLAGRRHQHDPEHALARDVRVADRERLHRHPAHRVTDEHRVAQVERFEHAAHVVGEVVDRVPGVADGATRRGHARRTRCARKPAAGIESNCFAHVRDDSVTPCANRIGGPSPRLMT